MSTAFKTVLLAACMMGLFSCTERSAYAKETSPPKAPKLSQVDTLTFTSGIRAIFHDSHGNYWFGSHGEGVARYDGKTYEYFTSQQGLADNQVRSIQEDEHGRIWFGTANGVSNYEAGRFLNRMQKVGSVPDDEWAKTDTDLWFGAGNKAGVYRYDGQQLRFLTFPLTKPDDPFNTYHITGLASGENDMLWMSTYAGVFGYDGVQFTLIDDEHLNLPHAKGGMHVRSILEDSQGRLWIGNNGIGVLLLEEGDIIHFSDLHDLIHPASSGGGDKSPAGTLEHVFAIAEDKEGHIWFGDRDTGAWRYDGKTVTHFGIDAGLKPAMIWDIYKDRDQRLLFALAEGGVYAFNGHSFERRF